MTRAWVLNLRAEEELAAIRRGESPPRSALDAPEHAIAALVGDGPGALVRSGDVRLPADRVPNDARAAAWCPTPLALAAFGRAGIAVEPGAFPSASVLGAANARETFADVDPLPGAFVARSTGELDDVLDSRALERASGAAPAWLLRGSLCANGRARLVVEGRDARTAAFLERHGPVHVEPLVDVEEEFALHGLVRVDGGDEFGAPVRHVVRGGSFVSAALATDLDAHESTRLRDAASAVAARLRVLGYHGPFGVDAFRWRDASGARGFHAPSEVNARYTMTWALGMSRGPTGLSSTAPALP